MGFAARSRIVLAGRAVRVRSQSLSCDWRLLLGAILRWFMRGAYYHFSLLVFHRFYSKSELLSKIE